MHIVGTSECVVTCISAQFIPARFRVKVRCCGSPPSSNDDQLVLEDEGARMALHGDLPVHELVTGEVASSFVNAPVACMTFLDADPSQT